ncbi:MAG: hypothetical protein KAS70_00365 [Planctomycetes bacterium]|nr:hypothetical protein [Planctomycetota bacterium]
MINIRKIKSIKEYHDCETMQQKVWQFTSREIIPLNELLTIQKNGGLVLGAFKKKQLIGFLFGFPGLYQGHLTHCSRMLAVLPAARNTDIGRRLKLAQRRFALKQGNNLISWTFDPLQSLNAYFNLVKLGVIIKKYEVNLYGQSNSVLNQGFQTDRFLVEWWIRRARVKKIINKKRGTRYEIRDNNKIVNRTYYRPDGLLVSRKPLLNLRGAALFVEIPRDIMRIKNRQPSLARDWRRKTRQIFTAYFNKSYTITGFIRPLMNNQRRSFYVMQCSGRL